MVLIAVVGVLVLNPLIFAGPKVIKESKRRKIFPKRIGTGRLTGNRRLIARKALNTG